MLKFRSLVEATGHGFKHGDKVSHDYMGTLHGTVRDRDWIADGGRLKKNQHHVVFKDGSHTRIHASQLVPGHIKEDLKEALKTRLKTDGKPDDEESAELHQNSRAGGQVEFEKMHTRKVAKDPEDNQARSSVFSGKNARAQNQGASLGANGEKTRPAQGSSSPNSAGTEVSQTPKGPGSSNGVPGDTSVVRTSPSSVKTDAPSARLAFSTFREEIEEIDEAPHPWGSKHRVHLTYDDPSGKGVASVKLTTRGATKEHAKKNAVEDWKRRGHKNVTAKTATLVGEEIEEIVWDDDLSEEEKQLNMNLGKGKGVHQTIYHGHFSFPHYSHAHGTRGIQHERVTSLSKEDIIAHAKKHHPNVTIHSISTGKVKRGGVWDHPGVSARSGEFEPHYDFKKRT